MDLPDPTIDLNWGGWVGSINSLFEKNAKAHPERLCVAETASTSSPRREFNYRQINEASNILAHHLVQNGIERGEVVMCYAYRGVDLVVAVMGILKAGATFSVIDPLYPPDRQIVYLDVARPRALVVIEKATQEAGGLSEAVRTYISKNLILKTELSSLILQDGGTLFGCSASNDRNVLEDQILLKDRSPNITLGPDDIPTLSFTSGSEGRPKGVQGRHFSLAYYFPWMSKRFNLTKDDRFTMLSGIAHDPIQRDIFTPLFLGAHLLVPSKEDIQHEKLAEWMRKEKATVTHLTPAMGQILMGGASAIFPSLHHAFFVGDVLIKRDCHKLQGLAPNVYIINMYGTTETQRSVSYFEVPSHNSKPSFLHALGDVIPAGRGMKNVQLLVVDREDKMKICGPGVVGEIYVRAGGLAEGYLGLDDLTNTKFISNWFVDSQNWTEEDERARKGRGQEPWREYYKGPRDRLYRSGDLGTYMDDGNVAITGRADDQIKIRGFRIELGEINTYLSQHPLIQENITLVRRDKDEEQTLCSYFVPDMAKWPNWLQQRGLTEDSNHTAMNGLTNGVNDASMETMLRRFQALRDDIREHLKTKLPSYAVPTVFVPLIRMPITPNGKVDKQALPFPEPSQLSITARRPSFNQAALSPTEKVVAEIWARRIPHVTAAKTLSPDDSFFDLGGHSLLGQLVLLDVRKRYQGINLSLGALFQYPTLRAFSTEIDRVQDPIGLRFDAGNEPGPASQNEYYSSDAKKLANSLPVSFPSSILNLSAPLTILLTGGTGFLGGHITDVLSRFDVRISRIIVHVRANTKQAGLKRIRNTCTAYGLLCDARVECIVGDLAKPRLGLEPEVWDDLAKDVDVIIHNGAKVHWVLDYASLWASNVQSTIELISLCATGKSKQMAFVSSTSTLDTEHYLDLGARISASGGRGVPEGDNLEGSSEGLGTGYGQSKWVAEYLMREAGKRGMKGVILRPGYVTGESKRGTAITDDFLVRLLKGCIQLSSYPTLGDGNFINMMPVDGVAQICVAAAIYPPTPLTVVHATSRTMTFNNYLGTLSTYGYAVPRVPYETWKASVERYVAAPAEEKTDEYALLPLYHFVVSDLPSNTQSPALNSDNAKIVLGSSRKISSSDAEQKVGFEVTEELVGTYISYLCELGFIPRPPDGKGKPLPKVEIHAEQKEALSNVAGRGAIS